MLILTLLNSVPLSHGINYLEFFSCCYRPFCICESLFIRLFISSSLPQGSRWGEMRHDAVKGARAALHCLLGVLFHHSSSSVYAQHLICRQLSKVSAAQSNWKMPGCSVTNCSSNTCPSYIHFETQGTLPIFFKFPKDTLSCLLTLLPVYSFAFHRLWGRRAVKVYIQPDNDLVARGEC